jgi:hypothetical protein
MKTTVKNKIAFNEKLSRTICKLNSPNSVSAAFYFTWPAPAATTSTSGTGGASAGKSLDDAWGRGNSITAERTLDINSNRAYKVCELPFDATVKHRRPMLQVLA